VSEASNTAIEPQTCPAETAGYDGMFGVYCELPIDHAGPHNDGFVEWDFVDPRWRNNTDPPKAEVK